MKLKTCIAIVAALGGFAAVPAGADEAKAPISANIIMNMFARPVESREIAFDQALREDGPKVPGSPQGEVVGDGTVRYGRASITVKNPCPPGHDDGFPKALPGRRK